MDACGSQILTLDDVASAADRTCAVSVIVRFISGCLSVWLTPAIHRGTGVEPVLSTSTAHPRALCSSRVVPADSASSQALTFVSLRMVLLILWFTLHWHAGDSNPDPPLSGRRSAVELALPFRAVRIPPQGGGASFTSTRGLALVPACAVTPLSEGSCLRTL